MSTAIHHEGEADIHHALILIADKSKLAELTAAAELHPAIKASVKYCKEDSRKPWWKRRLPSISLAIGPGHDLYTRLATKDLRNTSESDLLDRLNIALELGIDLKLIDPSTALKSLKFDQGHIPQNGVIYIHHPINPGHYIEAKIYSQAIATEKCEAFQQLAASLGAKRISLTSVHYSELKSGMKLKAPIEEAGATIGLQINADESGKITEKIVKEFGQPAFNKPHVPTHLEKWVNADSRLKTMVSDRLIANATKTSLTLEFSESLGMGATISAKLKDGETIGSYDHKAISKTSWSFDVEYYVFPGQENHA